MNYEFSLWILNWSACIISFSFLGLWRCLEALKLVPVFPPSFLFCFCLLFCLVHLFVECIKGGKREACSYNLRRRSIHVSGCNTSLWTNKINILRIRSSIFGGSRFLRGFNWKTTWLNLSLVCLFGVFGILRFNLTHVSWSIKFLFFGPLVAFISQQLRQQLLGVDEVANFVKELFMGLVCTHVEESGVDLVPFFINRFDIQ